MKIRCQCGRLQEVKPNLQRRFVMPDHDNYMKTETCSASGKTCSILGYQSETPSAFPVGDRYHGDPHRTPGFATLAMMLAMHGSKF